MERLLFFLKGQKVETTCDPALPLISCINIVHKKIQRRQRKDRSLKWLLKWKFRRVSLQRQVRYALDQVQESQRALFNLGQSCMTVLDSHHLSQSFHLPSALELRIPLQVCTFSRLPFGVNQWRAPTDQVFPQRPLPGRFLGFYWIPLPKVSPKTFPKFWPSAPHSLLPSRLTPLRAPRWCATPSPVAFPKFSARLCKQEKITVTVP